MQAEPGAPWTRRRAWIGLLALAIVFALLTPFDKALYRWAVEFQREHRVLLRDWMDAWGVAGWVPFWWLLAWASWLVTRAQRRRGQTSTNPLRPLPLVIAPALAGLLSEGTKLLVRRSRPSAGDGDYVFRPYSEGPFDSNGLGLPSSETAVAFAACFVLDRAFPAARPIWIFFAVGCGFQRMLDGKHFATDAVVAAALGIACAQWTWQRTRPKPA